MTTLPTVHPTVVHMLRDAAARAPEATALVCGDERVSYGAYWERVAGFARHLHNLGVDGERVALLLGNGIPAAVASYGAMAARAQLLPLNPLYTSPELRMILRDAAPRVVVHDGARVNEVAGLCAELGIAHCLDVAAAVEASGGALALPEPNALGLLQYTGGTSGRPKGVDLTHAAIATNVAQREALLPTRADAERILSVTPLYHAYGSAMGLSLSAYCRGTLVILPRFRPEWVLEAIERERITLFLGTPTLFTGLLARPDFARYDLSSLRLCYSGSAALPAEVLRRWEAATGCGICEGYGQTEAGPVLAYNPQDGVRKIGSVGIALPQTELQIVDPLRGTQMIRTGERGEIRARGPQIMRGYRNNPAATTEALRDGWLYTGDIGEFDADGYLYIRDRKKDMVIVAGFNVYPREVEEVLFMHPAIQDVAVVGRPDAYRGEALTAFVVARERPGDLEAFLAERLVRYKIPSDIRVVDALPRTGVGKVDKQTLREAAKAAPMDLEAEYNNRARVTDSAAIIAAWARDAAAFRDAHRCQELGLAYGSGEREKLDLFWPEQGDAARAPLALFIHGGYWQALDRSFGSMLARGMNARGIAVAMPSYDLCPSVTVARIVEQMRAAALFLHRRLGRPMLGIGHSVGGHLAAMLMATDWAALGAPAHLVGAGLPISGVFELEPLRATSLGVALALDADEALRLSPRSMPSPGLPLRAVVGGAESDEFRRQTRDFAAAWGGRAEELPGANHFTVLDPLTDPTSGLVSVAVTLAEPLAPA